MGSSLPRHQGSLCFSLVPGGYRAHHCMMILRLGKKGAAINSNDNTNDNDDDDNDSNNNNNNNNDTSYS